MNTVLLYVRHIIRTFSGLISILIKRKVTHGHYVTKPVKFDNVRLVFSLQSEVRKAEAKVIELNFSHTYWVCLSWDPIADDLWDWHTDKQ